MPILRPDSRAAGGHRRRARLVFLAIVVGLVLGARGTLAWYVDALWFDSLGFGGVFWKTLELKSTLFCGFTLATFLIVYAALRLLQPGGSRRPRPLRQRAARLAVSPAARPRGRVGRGAGRRPGGRVGDDGRVDGVRSVPPRAGARRRRRRHRPDLRTPDRVLPLHAASLAAHRHVGDDAQPGHPGGVGARAAAVERREPAGALGHACAAVRLPGRVVRGGVPAADDGRAGGAVALRAAVRRTHDLLGHRLHRGPHRRARAAGRRDRARRSARSSPSTTASGRAAWPFWRPRSHPRSSCTSG